MAALSYRTTFSNQTMLTILGSTHQLGTAALVYQVYDTAGQAIDEGTFAVNAGTYTVTLTFNAPQSGSVVLIPALTALPAPPSPAPTPTPGGGPASSVAGGMEAALQAMLVETIQQAVYSGQDAYGKPTYAAPFFRPARLQYEVTTVANASGQERTSTTKLFLNGDRTITVRDKVTLPDGSSPAIQMVYSARDLDGSVHHYECAL